MRAERGRKTSANRGKHGIGSGNTYEVAFHFGDSNQVQKLRWLQRPRRPSLSPSPSSMLIPTLLVPMPTTRWQMALTRAPAAPSTQLHTLATFLAPPYRGALPPSTLALSPSVSRNLHFRAP